MRRPRLLAEAAKMPLHHAGESRLFCAVVLTVACVVLLVSAAVPAFAIGFDAEKEYGAIFVIESGNSMGSGFAIGTDCIVSNAHVIGDRANVTVNTYDGRHLSADIIAIDEQLDLVLLRVTSGGLQTLRIGDETVLPVGVDVYAVGAPDSMAYTLTRGVLSAKDRQLESGTYLQFDAAINSGNSGGPLLNDRGEVIGVNTLKLGNAEGIGLAIPISKVRTYLKASGIAVDASGTVTATIAVDATPTPPQTGASSGTEGRSIAGDLGLTPILLVAGGAVLLLVAILVGLSLVRSRTVKPVLDETDRTDFDIDILE